MKTIELLLLTNIENLGIVGDVVSVKPGYARNFLLPHGYAQAPTPEAIESLKEARAEAEKEMQAMLEARKALHEKLEGHEITLERSCNEQGVLFGGVSQHDIAVALQGEGLAVEERHVRIGSQIKRVDSYDIPIVLSKDLKTEIKLWVVSDRPLEMDEEEPAESEEGAEGEAKPEAKPEADASAASPEAEEEKQPAEAPA